MNQPSIFDGIRLPPGYSMEMEYIHKNCSYLVRVMHGKHLVAEAETWDSNLSLLNDAKLSQEAVDEAIAAYQSQRLTYGPARS